VMMMEENDEVDEKRDGHGKRSKKCNQDGYSSLKRIVHMVHVQMMYMFK